MAEKPIVLYSDTTTDLGEALQKRYDVHTIPLHVTLEGKEYLDSVNITADELYKVFYETKKLPKTSAINAAEFVNEFRPWVEKGYEVLVFTIGSALSSTYQSACMAAEELQGVYPVDTCNLSSGGGLLVIKAAELIKEGKSAAEIQKIVQGMTSKSHASFVVDTLEFLSAGGRCSAVTAFAANLLSIKPSIVVDNLKGGAMSVGKKYRGRLDKAIEKYIEEELSSYDKASLDTARIFITHSGVDESYIELAKNKIMSKVAFDEIHVTRAGSTISSHCGPGTLGILFMTK